MDSRDDDWGVGGSVVSFLPIKAIFVAVVFAIQLVVYSVKLLISIVLRLGGLGVPWWLTIGSLALFPFACLLAVRWFGSGQAINALQLTEAEENQDTGRSPSFDRRLIDPQDGSRFRPQWR